MNEHSYIKSIHKRLPPTLYKWKINDNFHGGVADAYYSGAEGDLWVEYKYISNPPKKPTTVIQTCLTKQQLYWLGARQKEGRSVALIIGIDAPFGYQWKDNLVITDLDNMEITLEKFSSSAIDKRGVAEYIMNHCLPNGARSSAD
jgi:hypothetical protein|tara:strand:- start:80 stop:514 length:435 start_codon:yes stop_codon:yes gene_type:complete